MNKKIVITGSSGFTGQHACAYFAAKGWQVNGFMFSKQVPLSEDTGIFSTMRFVYCDVTNKEELMLILTELKPNAILHLAGQNDVDFSWQHPDLTLSTNVMSTIYLLEYVRKFPSCRLLIAGSILGGTKNSLNETSPYHFSKFIQIITANCWQSWFDLDVILAEPSNLIGPGPSTGVISKIARWAVQQEKRSGLQTAFRLSSLTEKRNFLDVRDVVIGYELLLCKGKPGQIYPLESSQRYTLKFVRDLFNDIVKVPLEWIVTNSQSSPSPQPRDLSLIRDLGWSAQIPFKQSLKDILLAARND